MPGGIISLPGAVILQSGAGTTQATVDPAFKALRVNQKPIEHGTRGHYRLLTGSNLVASQAANSWAFSLRWSDATRLMVVERMKVSVVQTAAATATLPNQLQAFIARSFTVSDSVGTAVTVAGNNQKQRTSFATSLVADCRITAVAAGLTAGTRTPDANPFLDTLYVNTITNINTISYSDEFSWAGTGHPIVLAQNEGIVVQSIGAYGVAGSAFFTVALDWAEVDAF